MSNRTIEAILRLSSRLGDMSAFRRVSDNFDKIEGKAKRFNRAQGLVAEGGRNMHTALMRYAAPGVVGYAGARAFTDFADVERRMTRIGITAEASEKQTSDAFQRAQALAHQYAMPVDEVLSGVETLVAAGRDLDEAMAFLPTVALNSQATGASMTDVANMADKAASALKISAEEMQAMMDMAIVGAQAGQFEMEDMAARFPELANSFASLGYEGADGARMLIATLQTLREDTASAEAAATQAGNVFGKMYSPEIGRRFADFGVDLRAEMDKAIAGGIDPVRAFTDLTVKTIEGDLTRLSELFTDQELRLGMQSLVTSQDRLDHFWETMAGEGVAGTAERNLSRVLDDARAKIDQAAGAWDRLKTSIGGAIAPALGGFMGGAADRITKGDAINSQLEKEGYSFAGRRGWWFMNGFDLVNQDRKAWKGGYRTDEDRRMISAYGAYGESRAAAPQSPIGQIPLPTSRPDQTLPPPIPPIVPRPSTPARQRADAEVTWAEKDLPSNAELREMMFGPATADEPEIEIAGTGKAPTPRRPVIGGSKPVIGGSKPVIDLEGFSREVETSLADGGDQAGQRIEDASKAIVDASEQGGSVFARVIESVFNALAPSFGAKVAESINANVRPITVRTEGDNSATGTVSGVRGRSMPNAGSTPGR